MPRGGEERAREFYIEALGMSEIPKPPELRSRGGAWFQSGGVALHLGVDDEFRPATKAHPALRCGGYDALLQRLRSHDVEIEPDERLIEGCRHCYIADPFGNRIELVESKR